MPGVEDGACIPLLQRPHRQVKTIPLHELLEIRAAHVIHTFSKRICQIEIVDPRLIGHDDIPVVRNTLRDPVVAAQRFHPPDLIHIGKSHAVHFVCSVFFQKFCSAEHPFPCAADVRENDRHKIFFADSSGLFGAPVLSGPADDQGVSAEHPLIGCDRLGGCHRHICGVDSCACPDAFSFQSVRDCGIAHGIARKVDLYMADDRAVMARLFLRRHNNKFLGRIFS